MSESDAPPTTYLPEDFTYLPSQVCPERLPSMSEYSDLCLSLIWDQVVNLWNTWSTKTLLVRTLKTVKCAYLSTFVFNMKTRVVLFEFSWMMYTVVLYKNIFIQLSMHQIAQLFQVFTCISPPHHHHLLLSSPHLSYFLFFLWYSSNLPLGSTFFSFSDIHMHCKLSLFFSLFIFVSFLTKPIYSLSLCPFFLLAEGRLEVNMSEVSLGEMERSLLESEPRIAPGGYWKPKDCLPRWKVSAHVTSFRLLFSENVCWKYSKKSMELACNLNWCLSKEVPELSWHDRDYKEIEKYLYQSIYNSVRLFIYIKNRKYD